MKVTNKSSNSNIVLSNSIGLVYILVLQLQIIFNFFLDTTLSESRISIIGYLACHSIGFLYITYGFRKNIISKRNIFNIIILMIYILLVILSTSEDTAILSRFISRYGMLHWFLIGIELGLVLRFLNYNTIYRKNKFIANTFRICLITYLIPMMIFIIKYISNVNTVIFGQDEASYQSLANCFYISSIITLLSAEVIFKRKETLLKFISYLTYFFISITIILLGSTAALLYVIILFIIVISNSIPRKLTYKSIYITTGIIVLGSIFINSSLYDQIATFTRFRDIIFSGNIYEISSIQTRLSLLPEFVDQFSISPVFGNFNAEILSGSGEGNYMHSVILSMLTHIGILGTFIFIYFLINNTNYRKRKYNLENLEYSYKYHFYGILIIGSFTSFFIFQPLWFIMGILSVKPLIKATESK